MTQAADQRQMHYAACHHNMSALSMNLTEPWTSEDPGSVAERRATEAIYLADTHIYPGSLLLRRLLARINPVLHGAGSNVLILVC